MRIDKVRAKEILRRCAIAVNIQPRPKLDAAWVKKIEKLSELCEECNARTHIAFFCTALVAKATEPGVNVFWIKARSHPDGFSATSLCADVVAPLAIEHDFSIGVTGSNPLNNQPYFRISNLSAENLPVATRAQKAFGYMLELIREVDKITDPKQVETVLRSFIKVRKNYVSRHEPLKAGDVHPIKVQELIMKFVRQKSERGRRAQAVVAGIMDVVSKGKVETGRVNDPSRRLSGDVQVFASEDRNKTQYKAIEVRDKPVSFSDVKVYCNRCLEKGVTDIAVVMVHKDQKKLDRDKLNKWAKDKKLHLSLFYGWNDIVNQAFFWSQEPGFTAAKKALEAVHERLIEIEVSEIGIKFWREQAKGIATQVQKAKKTGKKQK